MVPRSWHAYLSHGDRVADGALAQQVLAEGLWVEHDAPRILLVDLDNLRAGPQRWAARMGAVVALARQADHVVLAGQEGQVRRARPHLAEFVADAARSPRAATWRTSRCWRRSTRSTCRTPRPWW